ncbi:MAG: hypothetical protein QOH26_1233, partial [Actinomycetota bacterium]|nr:hypothetical protein [Actinomycetota bacterium]
MHKFPINTVSVGITMNTLRPIETHWEAAELAAEMKQFAKREPRSSYAIDRRTVAQHERGAEGGIDSGGGSSGTS